MTLEIIISLKGKLFPPAPDIYIFKMSTYLLTIPTEQKTTKPHFTFSLCNTQKFLRLFHMPAKQAIPYCSSQENTNVSTLLSFVCYFTMTKININKCIQTHVCFCLLCMIKYELCIQKIIMIIPP